jgi:hypothetical protein
VFVSGWESKRIAVLRVIEIVLLTFAPGTTRLISWYKKGLYVPDTVTSTRLIQLDVPVPSKLALTLETANRPDGSRFVASFSTVV